MKTMLKIIGLFLLILFINLLSSCKKDKEVAPLTSTVSATDISNTAATLNGAVTANNLNTTVSFEYGLTISYGQISDVIENPITGSTSTNVSMKVSGLASGETYHFRAKATSSAGTVFGEDKVLITTIVDNENNNYNSVKIGTQTWMVENLRSAKFNDGSDIPLVTNNTQWRNLTSSGYCWYNNDSANKNTFGAIYNWYTVGTGNLCPAGWHVPTVTEWKTLITFLGGFDLAGGKLKEIGNVHWAVTNAASNESGFTAMGGGMRSVFGDFNDILLLGHWWGAQDQTVDCFEIINYAQNIYTNNYGKPTGLSVRCIRD